MADGTYFLRETMVLTKDSGGDDTHTVTWAPQSLQPGGVLVSGGQPVAGWTRVPGGAGDVYRVVADNATFPQSFVRQLWVVSNATSISGDRRYLAALPVANYVSVTSRPPAATGVAASTTTLVLPKGALNGTTADQLAHAFVVLWRAGGVTTTTPVLHWDDSGALGLLKTTSPPGAPAFAPGDTRYAIQNVVAEGGAGLRQGEFTFVSIAPRYTTLSKLTAHAFHFIYFLPNPPTLTCCSLFFVLVLPPFPFRTHPLAS